MLFHEAPLISPWQSSVPVSASRLRRVVALAQQAAVEPGGVLPDPVRAQRVRQPVEFLAGGQRLLECRLLPFPPLALASRSAISSGDNCGKHNTVQSLNRIIGCPYGFFSRHCPYHCLNSSGSPLHVL